MIFTIARVLQFLLLPPAGCLVLMAFGFLVIRGWRMLGRLFIASGFVLLYLVSIGPVTDALLKPLEAGFPPLRDARVKSEAGAVVVLGGGVRDLSWLELAAAPSETSLERLVTGVMLAQKNRVPLVLVGGSGDPSRANVGEAGAMARVASELGVRGSNIIVEERARNTLESAGAVKRLFKVRRILLVTSAYHMQRASGLFKKQGFDVIPAACCYRAEQRARSFISFIPRAENLNYSSSALAEYISLAWYTMSGDL
jgi:uncharacterized SAM-binding protein YcdF (DUF218 family)